MSKSSLKPTSQGLKHHNRSLSSPLHFFRHAFACTKLNLSIVPQKPSQLLSPGKRNPHKKKTVGGNTSIFLFSPVGENQRDSRAFFYISYVKASSLESPFLKANQH